MQNTLKRTKPDMSKYVLLKSIIQGLFNAINRFMSGLAICRVVYTELFDGKKQNFEIFNFPKKFYASLDEDILVD